MHVMNISQDFKCYHSEKVLNRYKFKGRYQRKVYFQIQKLPYATLNDL